MIKNINVVLISLIPHIIIVKWTCGYNETPGVAPQVLLIYLTVLNVLPFRQGSQAAQL
jgi:hypothetical protein